jgi:hypothetical protein
MEATTPTTPGSWYDTTGPITLNPGWAYNYSLMVWCPTHQRWNEHGLATRIGHAENGSVFPINESIPGTIVGRAPHHQHDGYFGIICMGAAPQELRRIFAIYRRSKKAQHTPPASNLVWPLIHEKKIDPATDTAAATDTSRQTFCSVCWKMHANPINNN